MKFFISQWKPNIYFSTEHIFSKNAENSFKLLFYLLFLVILLTDEGHEAISIRLVTELLHQGLGLLLGQLLSKVGQQTEQLEGHHGVVVIFVIELHDLNVVVEASLVLGVLAGFEHGECLRLGDGLDTLLSLAANTLNGLHGGVQVASPDKVSNIEGVNSAISLEVIDIKCEVNCWKSTI